MPRVLGTEYRRPKRYGYHGYSNARSVPSGDSPVTWEPHYLGELKASDFLIGAEIELQVKGSHSMEELEDIFVEITRAMGYDHTKYHMLTVAEDGSLTSNYQRNGLEIISEPCTYEIWMNVDDCGIDINKGLKKAASLGAIGEIDTETREGGKAGIHINLDRSRCKNVHGLDQNQVVMMIFNNNKKWIMEKFSRRENTVNKFTYCQYEKSRPNISFYDVEHSLRSVKSSLNAMANYMDEHSRAISLDSNKPKIIEFRIFASTTVPKYFKAIIQFVMIFGWLIKNCTLEEASTVTFARFLQMARCCGYREFIEYCEVPRINIKEDVD